jgi:hypothetical protein
MPMGLIEVRFDEALPLEDKLKRLILEELGASRYGNIEQFEFKERSVSITSMDRIALVYAEKVCLRLGGTLGFGYDSMPKWSSIPWQDHSWFSKIKIILDVAA